MWHCFNHYSSRYKWLNFAIPIIPATKLCLVPLNIKIFLLWTGYGGYGGIICWIFANSLPASTSSSSNSIIVYIPKGIFSPAASQVLSPLVEGSSMLLLKIMQIMLLIDTICNLDKFLFTSTFFFKLGPCLFLVPLSILYLLHICQKWQRGSTDNKLWSQFCLRNTIVLFLSKNQFVFTY